MPDEPGAVRHVAGSWRIRPFFQESEADQMERNMDLLTHQAWMKTYRFAEPWPADIKAKVDALYKNDIKVVGAGMGCMLAAYKCLETIHPGQPKYDPKSAARDSLLERVYDNSTEKTRSVDKMMETLQKDGMAGEPVTVTFDAKAKTWSPSPEAEVLKMFDHKQEGVYFFGVSVSQGFHTVILAVDNTPQADGKPHPRVFWLDQASGGLNKDVTGAVGQHMLKSGTNASRIWPLRPEQVSRDTP
jgi:hypothetical protein